MVQFCVRCEFERIVAQLFGFFAQADIIEDPVSMYATGVNITQKKIARSGLSQHNDPTIAVPATNIQSYRNLFQALNLDL